MKKLLICGLLVLSVNAYAETKKESCMSFLQAGMYNQVLEETCGFDGGVKDKMKAAYAAANCQSLISPSEINQASGDVLADTKQRADIMGISGFCAGNKQSYDDLASVR